MEALEKKGIADNTIIIYAADNGYYRGDRGFAGKWTHYDESLRVPLVIHDPRVPESKRGKVRGEMALISDLATTMIEWGGEEIPATHTGHSLVPLVNGETPKNWRTDFLCEFLAVPKSIPRWEGVRGTDWVYARYFVDGPDQPPFEFLHDLKNDPDERVNLTNPDAKPRNEDQEKALLRMRKRCDELVRQNGPPMKQVLEEKSKKGKARLTGKKKAKGKTSE
jgi:arylsulfatase A-like enzyme